MVGEFTPVQDHACLGGKEQGLLGVKTTPFQLHSHRPNVSIAYYNPNIVADFRIVLRNIQASNELDGGDPIVNSSILQTRMLSELTSGANYGRKKGPFSAQSNRRQKETKRKQNCNRRTYRIDNLRTQGFCKL
jgi:hypothetical protein